MNGKDPQGLTDLMPGLQFKIWEIKTPLDILAVIIKDNNHDNIAIQHSLDPITGINLMEMINISIILPLFRHSTK